MDKTNAIEIDLPEQQATLEEQLAEGYQYSTQHDSQVMEDFEYIDLENWDDDY